MEAKLKHLEFIQAVINRMANNSFFLKGWSVTVAVGTFALVLQGLGCRYIYLPLLILCFFWLLDGYYLSRERLFRALYDDVRNRKERKIDFSMDVKKFGNWSIWPKGVFSLTLLLFY
ncbi:MAG TPA: hypothetical protein VI588_03825, partial [Candidatus Gracilibacteria bacterium]|nr:hypothetical protein [Candidatus Gracilibacteria bacterium]